MNTESETTETYVEIPQGKLRGKKETSIFGEEFYAFWRIPYAKPPVADLRFQAPQPADGWTGIRDATTEGKVCPSADWKTSTYLEDCDEDSLFLNVFCRQNPRSEMTKRFPVMIWIHGGGFEFGSGNKAMCGPDFFMLYDVLLVTFNYRLGALGFLSLQTVECPGNYGLKDQKLAFEWVKNNIGHFGGDSDNITIFGVSAGGASVHYQTLALSNKGLFTKAIAQSGSALNPWAYSSSPRENAFLLGRRLGCNTQDDRILLDFLKKVPAKDIVIKSQGIISETEESFFGNNFLKFSFVPTKEPPHEGAFITKHPWELLKEGNYLDVPFITGICQKEMIISLKTAEDHPRFTQLEEFQQFIPKDIKLKKNTEPTLLMAKRIKELYFKDGIQLQSYVDVISDSGFNYGVYKVAKCRTVDKALKSPTYLYEFSYQGCQSFLTALMGIPQVIEGTSHGEDTSYLFRTFYLDEEAMRPGERDHKMMRRFTELWVNFATTGVPQIDDFSWKECRSEDLDYITLGENLAVKKGFLRERMKLWDDIYSAYYDQPK